MSHVIRAPFRRLCCLIPGLVCLLVQSALAVPMLPQQPPALDFELPRVDLAGRFGADRFPEVNVRIERGQGGALVARARAVLRDDPDSAIAHEVLGMGLALSGDGPGALEAFDRAAVLESRRPGPVAKRAWLQMETGDLAAARAGFEAALDLDADYAFAHRRLGLLDDVVGDRAGAIRHLRLGLRDTRQGYLAEAVTLARLLLGRGAYEEVVELLEPRVSEGSSIAVAQGLLGVALSESGRPADALERFDRALAEAPGTGAWLLGRAVALRRAGRPDDSAGALQGLLDDPAIGPRAHLELGLARLSAGDRAGADQALERAVEGGTARQEVLEAVARHHLSEARFDAAREAFEALIAAGFGRPVDYVTLSELHQREGDRERTLAVLGEAVEQRPDDPYLALRLGNALASFGAYEEAVAELLRARELAPEDPNTLRALGLAQGRTGQRQRALATARALVELRPDDPETLIFAAYVAEAADAGDAARSFYQRVLDRQRDNVIALNNLANLLVRAERAGEGLRLAERAVQLVPDQPQLLDTLGNALIATGRPLDAVRVLEQAAEADPELAVAHYHLGVARARLGQRARARQALERALALQQDASWAPEARALLEGSGG